MPKTTYDPELRKSDEGVRLYEYWRRIRRAGPVDPTWENYPTFHTWAMDMGYMLGQFLKRYDEALPYGPDNCYWHGDMPLWACEWCEKWDDTVSKIRRQLGLPPLKGGKS